MSALLAGGYCQLQFSNGAMDSSEDTVMTMVTELCFWD